VDRAVLGRAERKRRACDCRSWRGEATLRERQDLAARVDKRRPIRYGARP